jgi:hypothetical protein
MMNHDVQINDINSEVASVVNDHTSVTDSNIAVPQPIQPVVS